MFRATLALALFVTTAYAQTETGSVYGSVTDPSGAVVPSATVRLINVDRGTETQLATGSRGFYSFADVPPGHYRMEVEKSGFKLVRLDGLTVNVQENLERDFRLEFGTASESVTVKADPVDVNTTDGSVSTVVDRHLIDNLPLNGRTFQTLIALAPGVVLTADGFRRPGPIQRERPARRRQLLHHGRSQRQLRRHRLLPSGADCWRSVARVECIRAAPIALFRWMRCRNFACRPPRLLRSSGALPVGRSRLSLARERTRFMARCSNTSGTTCSTPTTGSSNYNGLPKPEERQNDFGGVFGGPIIKDKTFFFFSYEGLRLRQPVTQETVVPDAASRQDKRQSGDAAVFECVSDRRTGPNAPDVGPEPHISTAAIRIPPRSMLTASAWITRSTRI